MNGHHWQVWYEENKPVNTIDGEPEKITFDVTECEGSHAKCLKYYRQHGGASAGLHLGYTLED